MLTRRDLPAEAVSLARSILAVFPVLLEVGAREMTATCDLLESMSELSPRDAVHAATMLTHDISVIVTADIHFDQLAQVQRISPDNV